MSEPAHILIIDDDDRLRDLLRRFLSESGFRVTDASDASQARHLLSVMRFDLLVIDVMMPGQTGVEFLAELRQDGSALARNVPALFLTAMAETEHRIEGLEAGADDYIGKPFEPRELILRIERILARQPQATTSDEVSFGSYQFTPDTGRLAGPEGDVHLTTAERDLLRIFAQAANQTLSREDIASHLTTKMEGRSIDVAIARLRRKFEQDPKKPHHLVTVRGAGWQLRTGHYASAEAGR